MFLFCLSSPVTDRNVNLSATYAVLYCAVVGAGEKDVDATSSPLAAKVTLWTLQLDQSPDTRGALVVKPLSTRLIFACWSAWSQSRLNILQRTGTGGTAQRAWVLKGAFVGHAVRAALELPKPDSTGKNANFMRFSTFPLSRFVSSQLCLCRHCISTSTLHYSFLPYFPYLALHFPFLPAFFSLLRRSFPTEFTTRA